MKFLFFVLAFVVAAQASILDQDTRMVRDRTTMMKGDQVFWTRQMNLLRLFNHYKMANANTDQVTIARNFKLDTLLDACDDKVVVKRFLLKLRDNLVLPRYQVFSITNKLHREDAKLIVNIFLGIENFETFYEFACWVREFMNQDLFLYTINVAMVHRLDCRGMMLPVMYEIVPNKFFNDEVISIAKRIKMQGGIFDNKDAQRGGIKKIDDKTFLINSLYSCWFLDTNKECKMNYFTEDVELNNKYFLFHILQPFWMYNDAQNSLLTNRRGEYFLYVHKQLLNRYYLERLSNDLGEIPRFKYHLPITTGMTTTLKHSNGMIMPSRPNDFLVNTVDNLWDMKSVTDYERRLRDAVDKGFIVTDDGKTLHLNRPEDIELLGDIIQSNPDCPNKNFYLNGLLIAKQLLGNGLDTTNRIFAAPSIMEQYETALRDPMFWQLWKRVYHYVMKFKNNLRPYNYQEVGLDGVTVTGIHTDKLETFFDTCDSDISNAVYRNAEEMTTNRDKFTFIARQYCLNHRKFNINIDYTSDKTMDAVVKIFLGPKFEDKILATDLQEDFLQLDYFMVNLKTGQNKITRESTKLWNGVRDMSYTTMMNKVQKCMTTGCDLDIHKWNFNMPNRLVLPKGKKGGMKFQLYVSITPFKRTTVFNKVDINTAGFRFHDLLLDDNAFGYPLDRKIDWTVFGRCSNMLMKDVVIYHDVTTDTMMNTVMFKDVMNKDLTMDKNTMYDFMTKDRTMSKHFMNKDFITRDYLTDRTMDTYNTDTFMGKTNRDMYNTDYMMGRTNKDVYNTDRYTGMMGRTNKNMYNTDYMMGKANKDMYNTDRYTSMMGRTNKNMYNTDYMMGKTNKDMYNTDRYTNMMGRTDMDMYDTNYMMGRTNKDMYDTDYMMGRTNKDLYDMDTYTKNYMMGKTNKDMMYKNYMNKDFMDTDYTTNMMDRDTMMHKMNKDKYTNKDYMTKTYDDTRFMDKFHTKTNKDNSYERRF